MKPPRFLFVHLSESCNLKCQHCLYWQPVTHDTTDNFPLEKKIELLSEFSAMNPRGVVVTCGAESTMDLEGFYRFTVACHALGLRCVSVSNGTKVNTDSTARRMVLEGPTELSISIDSHHEALHDEMRGVTGSFKVAVRAVRLLLAARRTLGLEDNRIHAMLLVMSNNYLELEDTYDFALNGLGVDKLKLNFLQPTFGCSSGPDEFFVKHSDMDPDKLAQILRRCNERFSLDMNPVWMSQAEMYVRSVSSAPKEGRGWSNPIKTTEHICNSYERNIVVDMKGVARLCVSEGYPGVALRRPGDMRNFWETAETLREKMRKCNHLCGITHSMRRVSTTFGGLTHFD